MIVIPASLRSDFIHMAGMTIHIALESTIHIAGIRKMTLEVWRSVRSDSNLTLTNVALTSRFGRTKKRESRPDTPATRCARLISVDEDERSRGRRFIHNLGQRSVFILNLNDFYRHIVGVFVRMRPLPSVPQHKRCLLLFVFLHLARVEDKFPVRVSDDYVANLLDVERTGQTMRMDWLFAVWWDCYFQNSDVLILKDDLVSFRRYFHAIEVSGPRAYPLRAIIVLGLSMLGSTALFQLQ